MTATDKEKNGTMWGRVYSTFTTSHTARQPTQQHPVPTFQQAPDLPDDKIEIAESMEPSWASEPSDQSTISIKGGQPLAGRLSCAFHSALLLSLPISDATTLSDFVS